MIKITTKYILFIKEKRIQLCQRLNIYVRTNSVMPCVRLVYRHYITESSIVGIGCRSVFPVGVSLPVEQFSMGPLVATVTKWIVTNYLYISSSFIHTRRKKIDEKLAKEDVSYHCMPHDRAFLPLNGDGRLAMYQASYKIHIFDSGN